jgi:hypothetical protein
MRWAIFFPFPGTKSYTICKLGNLIDYRKMDKMDNYFCASCLRVNDETDLYIRKLQRTFHWRVNARAGFDVAPQYQRLVDEADAMNFDQWHEASDTMLDRDRQISNAILAQVNGATKPVQHYSIRYTEVMAVDSDFILAEKGDYKHLAARRWRAFRENIDQARQAAAHLKQVATTLNGANGTVGALDGDDMADVAGAGCVNAAPKGKIDMPDEHETVDRGESCSSDGQAAGVGVSISISAKTGDGASGQTSADRAAVTAALFDEGQSDDGRLDEADEAAEIGAGEWRSIPKDGSGMSPKHAKLS